MNRACDRGECKDILTALAMTCAAEARPRLAVERRLERVDDRRLLAPIDLESAESRDNSEVDLQPRLLRGLRYPLRRVLTVDRKPGIAAAGGRLPPALRWDARRMLWDNGPRALCQFLRPRRRDAPQCETSLRLRQARFDDSLAEAPAQPEDVLDEEVGIEARPAGIDAPPAVSRRRRRS